MTVDIDQLTEQLSAAQAREVKRAYRKQAKDETAAFLWCFFLGVVGAHRFYLRQWTRGLLHLQVLLVAALVVIAGIIANLPPLVVAVVVAPFILAALIWTFVDLAHIDDEVSERNLLLGERLVAAAMLADPQREQQAEALLTTSERKQPVLGTPPAAGPAEQFTPDREAPPPLDVGVQAMTGVAGLGIAGGYRAVAEPAHDSVPAPRAAEPVAPAWDASTQPAEVPSWDTPTPPPSFPIAPIPAPLPSTATAPARDLTDLGGDIGAVPPIADLEGNRPWQIAPGAASSPAAAAIPQETGAEDVGMLVLVPEPESEPFSAPPVWPAPPTWPAPVAPPEWPAPAAETQPALESAPQAGNMGGITQDMLADAAGLAGAGGIGAMDLPANEPPAEVASQPAQPPEPTPQHLLRHIRVVRQVTVGDTVEETVAEAYIDPNDDPEPVRERLREQLRHEAEARQADQSNIPNR